MNQAENQQSYPVVLAISGASGFIYGFEMLRFFLENHFKVELVLSDSAAKVAKYEHDLIIDTSSPEAIKETLINELQKQSHNINDELLSVWGHSDIAASVSSGSYRTQGMIVAPCSMATLANIAHGTSNNLIARAADVVIKEKRKLVLMPRETPLSPIHLKNMYELSQIGVHIVPAAPGFYHRPEKLQDMVDFMVGKTLDAFGVDHELFKRWIKGRIESDGLNRTNPCKR